MTELEDRLHELAADGLWNSTTGGDVAARAVTVGRRRRRRRSVGSGALVCAVIAAGGAAVAHPHHRGGPAQPSAGTDVAYEGMSATAPAGWTLSRLSPVDSPTAVVCIGPVPVTWTPDPDPAGASPDCVGGVMLTRRVSAAPLSQPSGFSGWAATPSCVSFGLGKSTTSGNDALGPKPAEVGTTLRIAGRRFISVNSFVACDPPGTAMLDMDAYIAWDSPQTRVTLAAASPLTPGVLAVLHSLRIDDRPFREPSTPPRPFVVQDHGVTLALPAGWGAWNPGGPSCLGKAADPGDAGSVVCPLDGLLVRGARFFAGTGVAGQMGEATPDPWSVLGYRGNPKKAQHDVPPGCRRLVQLGLAAGDDPGTRTLVDQGERPVAGAQAHYRAWRTTCDDGTTFIWRRWWLPAQRTMFDSYDMPGGLTQEFVDDLLVHARLTG